jgi:hypothetical protein
MERAAFLIEDTNQRIVCMVNPESVVMRRTAGIHHRSAFVRPINGTNFTDDPLIFTGGGRTELELDLIFDVSITGSSIETEDVRDFTGPFWALSENVQLTSELREFRRTPTVRFVWGKAWNIPGVVVAVAERLERFTVAGVPRRSWLRMRMLRTQETTPEESTPPLLPENIPALPPPERDVIVHQIVGGGISEGGATERLDDIAQRYYGDPSYWRWIAQVNNIDDPLRLQGGTILRLPPLPRMQ